MILIGYSGHAYVAANILMLAGTPATHYCDMHAKEQNPYGLLYLGREDEPAALQLMRQDGCFIAIGNNQLREKVFNKLKGARVDPINAVHQQTIIAEDLGFTFKGTMISAGAIVNPHAVIGDAVILNTGCIIEHECSVGDFAHIGPGAVLCGNVEVGAKSFVGAGAVVRQGIVIGKNVTIGAGSVVVKDVEDNAVVIGNPAREVFPREGRL